MRITSLPKIPLPKRPTTAPQSVVEAQATPVSQEELRAALGRAHVKVTGQAPSGRTLDLLTAQASLETGRGHSMYNYNFGGIKGHGPSGMSAQYKTREVIDGREVQIVDGFRAYDSLDEGAVDYVSLLYKRYGGAIKAAESGDVDGFAHELKRAGYYTASEESYAAALRGLSGISGGSGGASRRGIAVTTSVATAGNSGEMPLSSDMLGRVMDALSVSPMRILAPSDEEGAG